MTKYFVIRNCRGTCLSVKMMKGSYLSGKMVKGYMVRERLGPPVVEHGGLAPPCKSLDAPQLGTTGLEVRVQPAVHVMQTISC